MDTNPTAQLHPWHMQPWQQLVQAFTEQRLPHALLLNGLEGTGKESFALYLSKYLLCDSKQNDAPCNQCQSCRLLDARTHPDFQQIAPEEEGKAIKVDQIRDMVERNTLTSSLSGMKIHLITDADKMNFSAANSLLKTLEEPSPGSLIILVTKRLDRLSATIKSRCQMIQLTSPETEAALQWLNSRQVSGDPKLLLSLASPAPVKALQIDSGDQLGQRKNFFNDVGFVVFSKKDPVAVAAEWQSSPIPVLINWMTSWVVDMIRLKFADKEQLIANTDVQKGIQKITQAFSVSQLLEIYSKLLESARLADTQANKTLLLESLLLRWANPKI